MTSATRLKTNPITAAFFLGLLFVTAGVLVALADHTHWAAFLSGVGSSLTASAVFAFFVLTADELVDIVRAHGIVKIFHNRRAAFRNEDWLRRLKKARQHFRVLGVANHGYLRQREEFRNAFLSALERRQFVVQFLWLRAGSNLAAARDEEEDRGTQRDIVDAILWFWELKSGLSAEKQQRFSLKEYELTPSCGLTWVDHELIVTHYLPMSDNAFAPGMVMVADTSGSALAESYVEAYQSVEDKAVEISSDRIAELRNSHDRLPAGPSEADLGGAALRGE